MRNNYALRILALKGGDLSGVNRRAPLGGLCRVFPSSDATACRGRSFLRKRNRFNGMSLSPKASESQVSLPFCLLRHVFSIWVSLTTITCCKSPLSTVAEMERRVVVCVCVWGVCGDKRWPKREILPINGPLKQCGHSQELCVMLHRNYFSVHCTFSRSLRPPEFIVWRSFSLLSSVISDNRAISDSIYQTVLHFFYLLLFLFPFCSLIFAITLH